MESGRRGRPPQPGGQAPGVGNRESAEGEGEPYGDRDPEMRERPAGTGGREALGLFGAWVGVYALRFLTQCLLAWALLPAGRGEYALTVMFASLLGLALSLSVDRGAQFAVMAGHLGVARSLTAAAGVCLAAFAVAAALALPLIGSDLAFFGRADPASFRLALPLALLVPLAAVAERQLTGLRRFRPASALLLLRPAAVAAGILVLVWGFDLGVAGAIGALVGGNLLFFLGAFGNLRRGGSLRPERCSAAQLRGVLSYGLESHPARLGEVLTPRLGVLALGFLAAPAEIGLFAAAGALVMPLSLASVAAGTALIPRVAAGEVKREEMVGVWLRIVCLATTGAAAVLLPFSGPLVRLFLSEAFAPIVPFLWIMAPGVIAYAGTGLLAAWFQGTGRPGVVSAGTGLGLAVHLGAILLLHPLLGVSGVAWALTLDSVVRLAFTAAAFRRITGAPLAALFRPRRSDLDYLRTVARSVWRTGAGAADRSPDRSR